MTERHELFPEGARRLPVQREPEPGRAPHDLDGAEGEGTAAEGGRGLTRDVWRPLA